MSVRLPGQVENLVPVNLPLGRSEWATVWLPFEGLTGDQWAHFFRVLQVMKVGLVRDDAGIVLDLRVLAGGQVTPPRQAAHKPDDEARVRAGGGT